jgi:nicotinate-nucleotide adenylyltransferase
VSAARRGGLGVLGGAFNPPHVAHLLLAQEARWQLGLERVLLVTTGEAPHKEIEDDPGVEVRLEMTRRAAEGEEGIEASAIEVERDGPSYSYETLKQLHDGGDEDLVLLLGADAAAGLDEWKRPERIVELARLGIAARPRVGIDAARSTLEALGATDRAAIIEMPECGVSSTIVRERVAAGRPLMHLVPGGVVEMIEREGIYR